ncbi:Hypothetical protein A7982_08987 [Minicystis rosea]|nr:Hypothetical protein A7982_08987 [Minicystis rosea]
MDTTKMYELFTAAKPALLAMAPESLVRPRISRAAATQLTAILRREMVSLKPRFDEELSPARAAARRDDLEAIEAKAIIFYVADLAVEDPWTTEQKERRAELVKKVRAHDDTLSGWALPLFKRNERLRAQVADIVRGRGIRDDADDTIRWVALFRNAWSDVEGKTPVTLATLAIAEAEATELLKLLDAADDETLGSPRDLRRRAYTQWRDTYQELFHLGRYLLRADPEVAQRIPAIAPERSEPEETKVEEAPADPPKPA